jgi:hypothetical protein
MVSQADGVYTPNPWMRGGYGTLARHPWYNNWEDEQEHLALLSAMSLSAEAIRGIRPPVPGMLFPPRDGLVKSVPTIEDVLSIGPYSIARDDFSGRASGYQGSSYPSLNAW